MNNMVSLNDILETIEICRSVLIARQEKISNTITKDKTQEYIMTQTTEIQKIGHIISGIDIVKESIEKIYKEDEK